MKLHLFIDLVVRREDLVTIGNILHHLDHLSDFVVLRIKRSLVFRHDLVVKVHFFNRLFLLTQNLDGCPKLVLQQLRTPEHGCLADEREQNGSLIIYTGLAEDSIEDRHCLHVPFALVTQDRCALNDEAHNDTARILDGMID